MKKESGFTLIEVVVSLILVGVLAAIGGTMLTVGVQGYIFSKDCTEIAQKAELAFSRLNNEITRLIDVTADSTSSSISIKNTKGNKTIGLDDGKIKIALEGVPLANGDILIDDFISFTLTYYDAGGTSSPTWPVTNDIGDLSTIKIELKILPQLDTFMTFVAPRNNRRYSF